MTITADTPVLGRTISDEGVYAKLAGTPLESWAATFIRFSNQYGIDPNWIISYLQFETGFGGSPGNLHFSMLHNDPWDILCYECGTDPTCHLASNGYCYQTYPTMVDGIEAGFRLWRSYVDRYGLTTYFGSLWRSLCGTCPCGQTCGNFSCDCAWVYNVIAQADANSRRWPYTGPAACQYDGECPPGQSCAGGTCLPTIEGTPGFAIVVGLGFLAGGAITYWATKTGRSPLVGLLGALVPP